MFNFTLAKSVPIFKEPIHFQNDQYGMEMIYMLKYTYKKIILALILVLSVISLTAGCSIKAPDTNGKNETNAVDDKQSTDTDPDEAGKDAENAEDVENDNDSTSQENNAQTDGSENTGTGQKAFFSIGGLAVGDPKDKITSLLGSDYKEEYIDVDAYFGESFYKWTYDKGIEFVIGKDSGKILEIECTTPDLQTESGVKVGDTAEFAFEKYRSKYKTPVSRHSNDKLEGWFEAEDGSLIIFDMDIEDGTMINGEIKPDSKIEKIKLTNMAFMD